MSELGKRVAVAAVGIPVVLLLVFLGGWWLAVPVAVFAGLGTDELMRFARAGGVRPLGWMAAPAASALVLLASWQGTFSTFAPHALALVGLVTGLALLTALRSRGPEGGPVSAVAVTVLAVLYVGLALACAPLLHALPARIWAVGEGQARLAGLVVVALPLAVTWVGDASAFFAGSAWGRRKLAPTVSPNKSWEGFWAAVAGGAAAGAGWLLAARALGMGDLLGGPGLFALVGAVVAVAAVAGDLVESLLKREAGVKDSGAVFPGHGGVLDRIDSLLFTLPSAYVALRLLGGAG